MDVPQLRYAGPFCDLANYPEYFNVSTTQQQNPAVMKILLHSRHGPQLSLACVMNIRRKTGERTSAGRDLGWLCAICACTRGALLVIGEPVNSRHCRGVPSRLRLVVCFGGMFAGQDLAQGLKRPWQRLHSTSSHHQRLRQHHELHPTVCRRHATLAISARALTNNMALGSRGRWSSSAILIHARRSRAETT